MAQVIESRPQRCYCFQLLFNRPPASLGLIAKPGAQTKIYGIV